MATIAVQSMKPCKGSDSGRQPMDQTAQGYENCADDRGVQMMVQKIKTKSIPFI